LYAKNKVLQFKLEEEAYLIALNQIPNNPLRMDEKVLFGGGGMKFGKFILTMPK